MPAVSSLLTPATLLIKRAFGLKEALGLSRLVQGCSWIVVSRKARLRGLGGSEGLADLETGLEYIVSIGPGVQRRESMTEVIEGLVDPQPNNPTHIILLFFKTYLLPEAHDLEALEVVEVSPLGDLLTLLGVVAVVELLLDLLGLPLLLDGGGAGGAGELLDDEAGERDGRERGGVARNRRLGGGGGTVDKDLSCTR